MPNVRWPDLTRRPQRRQVASSSSFPTTEEITAVGGGFFSVDFAGELEAEEAEETSSSEMWESVAVLEHLEEERKA